MNDDQTTPVVAPVAGPTPGPDLTATSPVAPGPVTPIQRPPARGGARWVNLLLGAAFLVAVGGVSFAVGRMTAPSTAAGGLDPNLRPGLINRGYFQPGMGPGGNAQGGQGFVVDGGLTVEGTVESVGDGTLTIRTSDGRTVQVALDDDTTYHAQAAASAGDVTTGRKVLVRLGMGRPGAGTGGPTAEDVTVVP